MIPFNSPTVLGNEHEYISDAIARGKISGDGYYSQACHAILEKYTATTKAFLTTSATSALEMSALLSNIQPGDEVIMPSFTFVTTASAFALRGSVPVFVDIREDTLNIDENKIEEAITGKTRAIVAVHYGGVSCEMEKINFIAAKHGLAVIEDASQAIGSKYHGKCCGTNSDIGCYSFHETKNIVCGEGGAILLNNPEFIERAEIIREKGTNRSRFFRGEVDKYSWVALGSSYLPSDLVAAYLYPQLCNIDKINGRRIQIWNNYHNFFKELAWDELRLPIIPDNCTHNAHIYRVLIDDKSLKTRFVNYLKSNGIGVTFHYVPLHASPMGIKCCRVSGDMRITTKTADNIVRFPLYYNLSDTSLERIFNIIKAFGVVSLEAA